MIICYPPSAKKISKYNMWYRIVDHRSPFDICIVRNTRKISYINSRLLWYHESNKGQTKNEVSIIIFTFAHIIRLKSQWTTGDKTSVSRLKSPGGFRHCTRSPLAIQYRILYDYIYIYYILIYTNIQWNIDSQTRVVAARSPDDSYLYKSTHSHTHCTHADTYGRSWPYGNATYLAAGPGETVCEFIAAAINYYIMST